MEYEYFFCLYSDKYERPIFKHLMGNGKMRIGSGKDCTIVVDYKSIAETHLILNNFPNE